jgi:hypothetical protein
MARRHDSSIETVLLLGGLGFVGYKYVWPMVQRGGLISSPGSVADPGTPIKAGTPALTANTSLPLGIRQNNPGNIRYNVLNQWKGQTGNGSGYAIFSAPHYGYRAMFILLKRYIKTYGLNTIAKIAARWAPASENNTSAWARNVSSFSGIGANEVLNPNDPLTMYNLARGITGAENGASFTNHWGVEPLTAGWGMS